LNFWQVESSQNCDEIIYVLGEYDGALVGCQGAEASPPEAFASVSPPEAEH